MDCSWFSINQQLDQCFQEQHESFQRIKDDMQQIMDDIRIRQINRRMLADVQEIIDDINTRQRNRRVAANTKKLDDLILACIEDEKQETLKTSTLLEVPIAANIVSPPSEELSLAPVLLDDSGKWEDEQEAIKEEELRNDTNTVIGGSIIILDVSNKLDSQDTTKSGAYGSSQEDIAMTSSKKTSVNNEIKEGHEVFFDKTSFENYDLASLLMVVPAEIFCLKFFTSIMAPLTFQGFDHGGLDIAAKCGLVIERRITCLLKLLYWTISSSQRHQFAIIQITSIIWVFDPGGIERRGRRLLGRVEV